MLRNSSQIITIHDEILLELFNLTRENIRVKIKYGVPYLMNYYKTNKVVAGFKVMITDTEYEQFKDNKITKDDLIDKYSESLLLSNAEKYLLLILLDNYLMCKSKVNISLYTIEKEYRDKCIKYKDVVLNVKTYNRYKHILNRLCKKELYVKTSNDFRNSNYGVNNMEFEQQLVVINSWDKVGAKNIEISYSLGMYGRLIKNCKRFSPDVVPATSYYLNFSQLKEFLISVFLGRSIYVGRYCLKNPCSNGIYTEFSLDEVYDFVEDRTNEVKNNINRYHIYLNRNTLKLLDVFKANGSIYDYEVNSEVIRIIHKEPPLSYYKNLC